MAELDNTLTAKGSDNLLALTQANNEVRAQIEEAKTDAWHLRQKSTAYTIGNKVIIPGKDNFDILLNCTTAGTTSALALDYTGLAIGNTITDGTVVWTVIARDTAGSGTGLVNSVNGKQGDVTLNNTDVGAAATSHTHTKSEITDFSHTHTKSAITDFAHTHTKSDITDFAHTHTKSEITDFAHSHAMSDVTGLQNALNGLTGRPNYAGATSVKASYSTSNGWTASANGWLFIRVYNDKTAYIYETSSSTAGVMISKGIAGVEDCNMVPIKTGNKIKLSSGSPEELIFIPEV